jgi:serralysin
MERHMATILGTPGSDTIYPGEVSPGVAGGSPGLGADSILGGAGADSIFASDGDDTIRGEGEGDQIFGGLGADLLDGGAGDDFLRGFTGNDLILGGAGYDVADYRNDAAPISATFTYNGTAGHGATVTSADGIDTLREIEAINGTMGGDYIEATLTDPSSGFQARGYGGNDTIVGTAERSIGFLADYRLTGVTSGVVIDLATGIASNDGFGGQDSLVNVSWIRGTDFGDTLLGTSGIERFRGRGGNDYMDGRGGTSDILDYSQSGSAINVNLTTQRAQDGEGGTDTIIDFEEVRASTGGDTLIGSDASEQFQPYSGNDTIDGRGGQDRVIYDQSSGNVAAPSQGVVVNLVTGIATDSWGNTDRLISIERVSGSNFNDSIVGGAESNRLRGRAGNDTLDGGLGGDYVEYVNATTGVTVNLTTGFATDGQGGTDRLRLIEHIIGGNLADHLTGVAQLGRSTSLLRGGNGNDTLVGINGEFVVADYADQTMGLSINLASGIANDGRGGIDTLIAIRGLNMFGAFADTLVGSAANEWFSPSQGADSVVGGAGSDIIAYGGTDTGGVSVNLAAGRARDTGGALDTILGIEGVVTSFGDDTIFGNGLGNLFGPGAGTDAVHGGAGEDTVSYSLAFSPSGSQFGANEAGDRLPVLGVTVDLVTQRATDFAGDVDSFVSIEHAMGSTAGDLLRGNGLANRLGGAEGNDTIEGGAGNDTLDGGTGVDRMAGGIGNDTYVADVVGDIVTEGLNQGIDTIRTGLAAYVLKPNVEGIVATTAIAHRFTGNGLDNLITGAAGADTMIGGAGNDTLDGGTGIDRLLGGIGNDTYIVDVVGDVVIEGLNQGIDTVRTGLAAHVLAAGVENLNATTAVAHVFTGNGLGNAITGGAAADTINGGGGNDTLDGGAGIDRLLGGIGNDLFITTPGDMVVEVLNGGTDTVQATSGGVVLAANVENLLLAGTATNGVGNGLANVMTGHAGANILNGGAGSDTLDGGGGADVLIGGAGQDFLTGGIGADRFRFLALADSTVAAPDVIAGFNPATELDRIELNLLDANAALPGNQAFVYRGEDFAGVAGDLRVQSLGGGFYRAGGDVNGDGTADFAILIQSATGPDSSWFVP